MWAPEIPEIKLDTITIVGIVCGGLFAFIVVSIGVFQFMRVKNGPSSTTGTKNNYENYEIKHQFVSCSHILLAGKGYSHILQKSNMTIMMVMMLHMLMVGIKMII